VTDVTSSSAYLGIFEQRRAFLPEGRPRDDMWMLNHIQVDYNYLDVMKARLILGRDFSPTTEADSASIIINKSLVEQLEWKDPLGKHIAIPSMDPENDNRFQIIGVVDDFHFASLHQNVEPLVIMLQPKRINYLMVKTEKEGSHVVDQIEEKWATMFPSAPFDYFFQDTRYKSQYRSDFRMRKTFLLFTVLAIFIASIGIFGLALFSAIRRTREIGVRKVYGSSVMNIVLILSKRLFILIGISCILAFPFAWYYNDEWLKGFAYQITIPFWSFLISGMIAITAGIATIGLVSLKAARRNPTDVLRYE
jgi:putative ABC transport system permease protein